MHTSASIMYNCWILMQWVLLLVEIKLAKSMPHTRPPSSPRGKFPNSGANFHCKSSPLPQRIGIVRISIRDIHCLHIQCILNSFSHIPPSPPYSPFSITHSLSTSIIQSLPLLHHCLPPSLSFSIPSLHHPHSSPCLPLSPPSPLPPSPSSPPHSITHSLPSPYMQRHKNSKN